MQRFLWVLGALAMVALTAQCAPSTTLTRSFRDPSFQSGSLRKPLVVAVANKREVRVRLEDDLVLALRRLGVDGLSSHTVIPDEKLNVEAIVDRLPQTACDSVMVTHLVDAKREKVKVPSEPLGGVYPVTSDRWRVYYAQTSTVVMSPEYEYEQRSYVLETKLFDAKSERPVWSAVTETVAPRSLDSALQGFTRVLVDDLEKKHVFR